jgi:SAM-dependent methyltransferase
MLGLWRLHRAERDDPEPFYGRLATDVVSDLERRYGPLRGQVIADLGSGPGYYARAFAMVGAHVVPIERDRDELSAASPVPVGALVGDAQQLPLSSGSLDGVFSSNMLEHTPDPSRVIDEIARVLRPGGWAYVSFTNWFSPWGGHEMSPYHLLGARIGARVYERRHGASPKHRVDENLFRLHIGGVLRMFRQQPDLVVSSVEPRYWPWASFVVRLPGAREVLTWNCVVRATRRP